MAFFPASLPSRPSPPPAPGLRPPPCAAAINTRRPLILVGTVAAEVAGKRAAQDAATALRGPAGHRGTGGRGRQGWGARPPRVARLAAPCRFVPRVGGICGGHEWARRSDKRLSPLGNMLAGVACHRAPRPSRFCQAKMTHRAQRSLRRCLEGSARRRVERWRRGSQWG